MNQQLIAMAHLKKFYTAEIEKLQGVVQRLEHYIDQGIAFRREVADSCAVLRKAVADLNEKIAAADAGDEPGEWLPGE